MKMELIDREKLKSTIREMVEIPNEVRANVFGAISRAKAVDAVPVVRCKDCKYWHENIGWCDHHSYFWDADNEPCHPYESSDWKMLNEDDFCSYGEKREV